MKLQAGDAEASFDLDRGGRLSSLVLAGKELLITHECREAEAADVVDPMSWGAYPMVPWAGRVRDGNFAFNNAAFDLPIDLAPHAIHGTAYKQAWAGHILEGGSEIPMAVAAEMSVDLSSDWPFGGSVYQTAMLSATSLELCLTVRAADKTMPVMVGWHPWFRRQIGADSEPAQLLMSPASMYSLDAEAIPTGELVSPPDGPWDNCFTGFGTSPVLWWPGQLALQLTSDCEHWVVYDQPTEAICVEPQSDAPDSFNREPDVIQPGQEFSRTFTLRWSHDAMSEPAGMLV